MTQGLNIDFIKEQYAQYWQMKRMHLSLSWQIPALAVVAVVAVVGMDPEKVSKWRNMPLLPALGFLLLGLIVVLMFIHHSRNLLFASLYDKVMADMEILYGMQVKIHHFQVRPDFRWWQRLSSSTAMSFFLALLSAGLLGTSVYFFVMFFML